MYNSKLEHITWRFMFECSKLSFIFKWFMIIILFIRYFHNFLFKTGM